MTLFKLLFPALAFSAAVFAAESINDNFGSRSAEENGIIRKLNADGCTVWSSKTFPVKEGEIHTGTLTLDILERTPGAAASIRLLSLNEDKLIVDMNAEPSALYQTLFSCGTFEFERSAKALPGVKYMRLEAVFAGNPAAFRVRNAEIRSGQPEKTPAGIYTPKAPAPDRAAVLKSLGKAAPATAEVVQRNGRPAILLDGRETILKSYKGSIDYKQLAEAGINLIQTFNAGVTLFWDKMTWDMAALQPDGAFDFSRLENELLYIHNAAPEARVLINVNVDVGEDFFRNNPDSIFRDEKGELGVRQFCAFAGFGVPGPNPKKNRHWAVSYASEEYQQYVCRGLRELTKFLKQSPAGKIVAGFGLNGGHDDQFLQWEYSAGRGQADYSPANLRAYRKYLKQKYRTDDALRRAWGDPSVTLETAPMFRESEWKLAAQWSDTRDNPDRKIADGRDFLTDSIAAMNRRFARTLKEGMGRPVIVGTYYSSPLWGQAGRSSLKQLSQDNGIDLVFQVSAYSAMRKPGGVGASANFAIAAAHAAGLVYMQEMDHRTPRSQITAGWSRESLGYPRSFEEFRDQIYRDAGSVLASGGDGFYYFDMFDSWYNDPRALNAIRATCRAADWSVQYRDVLPRTQAALILDERERILNRDASAAPSRTAMICRLSGITPDILLLDDLTRKDLPDYKLWIVAAPQTLTDAQRDALKAKAMKRGNVVVITGSAGALHNRIPGLAAPTLTELGIQVRDRTAAVSDCTEFIPGATDPLAQGCSGRTGLGDLFITRERFSQFDRLPYSTVLCDPAFQFIGRWRASGEPAIGIKRTGNGATIIYSAQPDGLTPQFIHNAAKAAGITPHSAAGNAVAVGNGVISMHRLSEPVRLCFAEEMEFFDPETGKNLGRGKEISADCPLKGSRLICYRKPSNERKSNEN